MKKNLSSDFPKKYLGQHFLTNKQVLKKIIGHCDLNPHESVLEIGPGKGALTKEIILRVKKVIAVEKDRDLVSDLQKNLCEKNLLILNEDFLKFSFEEIKERIKIIGNIPYYISSPIINKIIENRSKIKTAFLMVQLEFGNRITAVPNSKDYGALSCFTQYYTQPKFLLKIKNTCFYPAPKVHSCFIKMDILETPPKITCEQGFLFSIIQKAFQQRRKTISNSLSCLKKKEDIIHLFNKISINPNHRAENLSLKDFIQIAESLSELSKK